MIEINKLSQGVSYAEYDKIDGLRAAWLREMMRSPAHLQEFIKNPPPATPAKREGQLIHLALENPERFADLAVIEPEFTGKTKDGRDSSRSGEAKQKKAEWLASRKPDDVVIDQETFDMIKGIMNAVLSHGLVSKLISTGTRESSIVVRDTETGLILKCRPDVIADEQYLIDYKSTLDAQPDSFTRDIFSRRSWFYILQAAHYVHCLKLLGMRSDHAILIAIEKARPHGIGVYPLDSGCLEVGEQWRARLTKQYADCLMSGKWPGYAEEAIPVFPPQYADVLS